MEGFNLARIGERIRRLRERLGLTQGQLAQVLGERYGLALHQSYISLLETRQGQKLPSVQVLVALALALETSADYLLGLTDDRRPLSQEQTGGVRRAGHWVELEATLEDLSEERQLELVYLAQALATFERETETARQRDVQFMDRVLEVIEREGLTVAAIDLLESTPGPFRERLRRLAAVMAEQKTA